MKNFTAFTKVEKGLIRVLKTQVAIVIDEKLNPNYIKAYCYMGYRSYKYCYI